MYITKIDKIFCTQLYKLLIDGYVHNWYNIITAREKHPSEYTAGGKGMDENMSMTNAQYDSMLETLARLIEVAAKTPAEAAQIVRDAKTAGK